MLYRNTSQSLGEREMVWEHGPQASGILQECFPCKHVNEISYKIPADCMTVCRNFWATFVQYYFQIKIHWFLS